MTIETHVLGMTLRDYFAAHAPQPSVSDIEKQYMFDKANNPYNEPHRPKLRDTVEIVADLRYRYADNMLAARRRNEETSG
jgi:hypothetical protein